MSQKLTASFLEKLDKPDLITIILQMQSDIEMLKEENAILRAENEQLRQENQELRLRVSELERQVNMNSTNSSKPPSTDGFKNPRNKNKNDEDWQDNNDSKQDTDDNKKKWDKNTSLRWKSGKKPGWQKGHKWRCLERAPNPDKIIDLHVCSCAHCNNDISKEDQTHINSHQVYDVPEPKIEVTEFRQYQVTCPCCHKKTSSAYPDIASHHVQYWPNLKAFAVYLIDANMLSHDRVVKLFKEVFWWWPSQWSIGAYQKQAYEALEPVDEKTKEGLLQSLIIYCDETGINVWDINRSWMHVASNEFLTHIFWHKKRWHEAMDEDGILERFIGYVCHDDLRAYDKYPWHDVGCQAHHERELNGVIQHEKRQWAQDMKLLFETMYDATVEARWRGLETLGPSTRFLFEQAFVEILERWKQEYPDEECLKQERKREKKRWKVAQDKWKNLLDRLYLKREANLAFMHDLRLPYTNNQAERDLRMIKVKAKVSGLFRSENGAIFFARIYAYISTLRKQDINVFECLKNIWYWCVKHPRYT